MIIHSLVLVSSLALCSVVEAADNKKKEEAGEFQGQKLNWKDDDGLNYD